ncbi:unnamed protein product [Amaranthus hypochondriacus]
MEEVTTWGPRATPPHHNQARRRQGIGTRVWLMISDTGDSRLDEVSKHQIMRRTGLPARDLRALDPVLSYPSSIFGRERAIVVNLEHIKAIITATEVLMINCSNPLVVEFVEDLSHRIAGAFQKAKESNDPYLGGEEKTTHRHGISPKPLIKRKSGGLGKAIDALNVAIKGSIGKNTVDASSIPRSGPISLPFEFRALEACLESACRCLEIETQTLEQEAYPALDQLTSQISTLILDRVRQIKSRLVAISGRVQKVRDQLENLLDDDDDMAEMYLTEKLKLSMEQGLSMRNSLRTSMRTEPEDHLVDVDEMEDEEDSKSFVYSDSYTYVKPNIEELEMLLEAYFAQVEGISQKLSAMSEYVGDTEDYINIMLDDKQNQLLQMGVMLSTANMIMNGGIVVCGIFGMNIHIPLFDGENRQFLETAFGTTFGCIITYLLAICWGRKKYLLSF